MQNFRIAKKLLFLLRPYPWALPLLVVLGLLAAALEGAGIYLFIPLLHTLAPSESGTGNQVIDALIAFSRALPADDRLMIMVGCVVGSIVLKNLVSYANTAIFSYIARRIGHQLRHQIFGEIITLDHKYLNEQRSGRIFNTLATETWRTTEAITILTRIGVTLCTCAVFVMLLLLLSWQMTLVTVACVALIAGVIQTVTRGITRLGQQAAEANAALAERMWETFAGLGVVRAFAREAYEQARYDTASQNVRGTFLRLDLLGGVAHPLSEVLAVMLVAGLVLTLGRDQAALPMLAAFLVLLYRLLPRVRELTSLYIWLGGLAGAVDSVMAALDRTDKSYIRSGSVPFDRLRAAIVIDGVTFRYRSGDEPALRDVSLCIPCGTTIALVGPSGAGKSTLVNLLCRFYDPDDGEIRVDGTPLGELNLTDWRSRLAIVSQDVHMFNTTIRDNIAYGRLDASDDEIVAAARLANAHQFIKDMPQGYATPVGERGVRLSGASGSGWRWLGRSSGTPMF